MSYCTHGDNLMRFVKFNRESDREKDEIFEGNCEKQCGILNISASLNSFSLRLRPIFKSITSMTISDRVISYTRRERNAMRQNKK